jgi:phosphoglycolate phosphatase-like HAD superfamily hydrolase
VNIKEIVKNKKVFIFDWDGTIFDSMKIKSQNFISAFCMIFPGEEKGDLPRVVEDAYQRLSGYPRNYIFIEIMEGLGKKQDAHLFDKFNSAFERLNMSTLVHAKIFPDAQEFLEMLVDRNYKIYISSSVPPDELSRLVEGTLPEQIKRGITSVFGSKDGFSIGKEHIQEIVSKTGAKQDDLLVLGDDIADHELSIGAGVDCILVNRRCLLKQPAITSVSSLNQVKDALIK